MPVYEYPELFAAAERELEAAQELRHYLRNVRPNWEDPDGHARSKSVEDEMQAIIDRLVEVGIKTDTTGAEHYQIWSIVTGAIYAEAATIKGYERWWLENLADDARNIAVRTILRAGEL